MTDIGELSQEEKDFLEPYLPEATFNGQHEAHPSSSRPPQAALPHGNKDSDLPFVTLTYACSLDSMIALAPGARTSLSGPQTKTMTHYLRRCHDAILIGAGTAVVDDPSLNCRYPGATLNNQPRPVIVDPSGRWRVEGKKAHRLAAQGKGKGPWVISCTPDLPADALHAVDGDYILLNPTMSDPLGSAEEADSASRMHWSDILRELKVRGVDSVMIEGGARVINDLLTLPELVDSIIVTVAPTFLGQGGVAVSPLAKVTNGERVNAAWIQGTKWRQFGNDVVLCGRLRNT